MHCNPLSILTRAHSTQSDLDPPPNGKNPLLFSSTLVVNGQDTQMPWARPLCILLPLLRQGCWNGWRCKIFPVLKVLHLIPFGCILLESGFRLQQSFAKPVPRFSRTTQVAISQKGAICPL